MAAKQEEVVFQETLDDMDEFLAMLGSVNSEKAQATVATDKLNIDKVIESEVGFLELDRMVFERFKQWMIEAIQRRMGAASEPLEIAKYNYGMAEFLGIQRNLEDGVKYGEVALNIYTKELGEKSFEALRSKAQLAMFYGSGEVSRSIWEPMLIEAISDLTLVVGRDHMITLTALHQLGQLYVQLGELDTGINLLLEVKELILLRYGSEHKYFILLGGELDLALAQYGEQLNQNFNPEEAYAILAKSLGDSHPFTLSTLENVAISCLENDDFIKAIELQTEVYQKTLRNFGPGTTEALQKLNMLGMTCLRAKYFDLALEKLESCLTIARKSCSPDSIAIVQALAFMGMVYIGLNKYELACTCFKDALVNWETQDIKTFQDESLYLLLDCHERLNTENDLNEVNQLMKWLHDTNQWNEVRKFATCTLCSIPELHGVYYICTQCPLNQILVCAACIEIVPYCLECGNEALAVSIPPPRRLLQYKIKLLEEYDDLDGANATKKELQEYCQRFNVPMDISEEPIAFEIQDEVAHEKPRRGILSILCPCFK